MGNRRLGNRRLDIRRRDVHHPDIRRRDVHHPDIRRHDVHRLGNRRLDNRRHARCREEVVVGSCLHRDNRRRARCREEVVVGSCLHRDNRRHARRREEVEEQETRLPGCYRYEIQGSREQRWRWLRKQLQRVLPTIEYFSRKTSIMKRESADDNSAN